MEQPGAGAPVLPLSNIKAPKNGYCFVYVSNESDEMVYFDNLQVTQNHARIIEENHYYAYGLKIAAISSKKMPDLAEGHIKNNNQYQGDYSEFDEDLGWNDFDLRNYDPQIGRWIQQDPFQEFPSPYTGMGNDPINNIDPTGGGIFDGLGAIAKIGVKTFLGAVVGTAIDINSGGDGTKGFAIGAGVGLLGGIAGNFGIRVIAGGVTKAVGMASGSLALGGANQVANYRQTEPNNNSQPSPLETEYRSLVEQGKYLEGVNKIIAAYPTEMNANKRYYKMVFSPKLEGEFNTARISNMGSTYSLITFGIQDILCLNFNAIVRNTYHELIHVKQQNGIQGVDQMTLHDEMEFDANYKTVTNTTLPNYTQPQIKKYLETTKKYYNKLPKNLRDKYKKQYDFLFTLKKP